MLYLHASICHPTDGWREVGSDLARLDGAFHDGGTDICRACSIGIIKRYSTNLCEGERLLIFGGQRDTMTAGREDWCVQWGVCLDLFGEVRVMGIVMAAVFVLLVSLVFAPPMLPFVVRRRITVAMMPH